jgi:predicted protein tyrosine phosphatase
MGKTHRRYLFVCAANRNRSPTAEDVAQRLAARSGLDIEVRSAGLSPWAERPLTKEMADGADLVFVMEDYMARALETTYGQDPRKIVCLDIPDLYERGDPVLVYLLEEALEPYLTA